jgi:hypothetical protein
MDLKLTPSGYPALVYCESAGNGILNLKYASRAGGQWNIQMVDSAAGPQGWIYGYDLSLAFDRNGNPGIYDNCNLYKYGAGSWSKTNAPITHWTPQLIFDIDNNPRLAGMYWSGNSDNLKYYTFYNTNWNWGEELEQMPDPAYNGISMKVDKDGIPSLAYSNNNQIILAKWYRVGDLDHNGRTNLIDLAILADQWCALTCRLENDWCKEADLDRNGFVLMKDLVVLCDTWLWQTTD